ncbi:cytochrome b [Rugamonas apoptosis]|uniref:Cytochrome b n=1 Tax=Rugamonas apoptosis TaxID=2758570 RepID=A0A7W2FCK2_9BURK|nr:cytochrome b/b6 domain-containing protein [Rugamonas apoptosis]MBA5689211.1 cytochrome b [Rugamonas apoptosis]
MKTVHATVRQYDARTIRLHWLTAGLVIALWALGETIDWFPRGTARVFARSTHISLGALLGLVLLVRIWWRATAGEHLPGVGSNAMQILAKVMHIALYACLVAVVVLGVANVWVRGDNLFNLVKVAAFDPGNKELRHTVEGYHELAANLLMVLAGLHAVAGLVHQYVFKDGVLARMIPGLGRR